MLLRLRAFWELTKPRLILLVIISAMAGYYLGEGESVLMPVMLATAAGISLASAGSMMLNQAVEHKEDAKMLRTRSRPVPSGRIAAGEAFIAGTLISLAGLGILAWKASLASAVIAAVTILLYVFVYTPMKKISPWCTVVGAVPGALPPLAGWAAAQWPLPPGAWSLFMILFFWQMPHFFSIGWMWRDDYRRAGFRILTAMEDAEKKTLRQILFFSLALAGVSLIPFFIGMAGWIYLAAAVVLDGLLLAAAFRAARDLEAGARTLFRMTLLYLTVLLIVLVLDRPL